MLTDRLPDLPQPELRALFDRLHLGITFQPSEHAVDVEVTLAADEPPDPDNRVSEVWSVPPGESDQTCDAWCGWGSGCACG